MGEAQQPDRAEEPVKRAMLPLEKVALAVPAVSEQGAGTDGVGMVINGLTPLLLISVEPRGMPAGVTPVFAPREADDIVPDAVPPVVPAVGVQLLEMPEALAVAIPDAALIPPPSKVEPDPPTEQVMIEPGDPGIGLKPPTLSSVEPSGIPAGLAPMGDVAPMPRGEVAPMPGTVGVAAIWATAGPPLGKTRSRVSAAAPMKRAGPFARILFLLPPRRLGQIAARETYRLRASSLSHMCSPG